jgi:type I restriction enzyme, S subunit
MNAAQVLDHFERISDAPDATSRIRRFVLELAVRGKLVEQDPNDEPASELFKRIQVEKVRLTKEGRIKKPILFESINESALPFEIPTSWTWIRLGQVSNLITKGSTPTSYGHSFVQSGINFIKVEAIRNSTLSPENITSYITQDTHEFLKRSQLASGDVLFSIAGSIGICAVVTETVLPANTNQALAIIRGANAAFSVAFLQYATRSSLLESALAKARGGAMNNISLEDVSNLLLPLPPFAEQHRIVAKVDELMALCDRLEAAKAERESRRDKLAAVSLHRLNNGANADEFRERARFHLRHLPCLTTRPEHIQQLRQTILNLAVRGKLVPQDPSDEPASELLKRIQAEKAQLLKEKQLKRQKSLLPIQEGDAPFEVPGGWIWAKADDVCLNITDGFHNTPSPTAAGRPYITAKHIRPLKIDFDGCLYVDEKNHRELFAKTRVKRGDILIVNIGAGCGTPALVDVDFEFSFKNVAILNLPTALDHNYILYFLMYYRVLVFEELIKGGAQPFLGLGVLREMLISLPPLPEQRCIVAKVDELMTLCDQLEAKLTITQAESRHLLDAVLHEALKLRTGNDRSAHL